MGTPLGDFIRATRDSIQPAQLGLPELGRRRAPGLRRSDLAARAGISVEYLTRLEQGRDRHPSTAIVNAIADALSLGIPDRSHLHYLAKISGGACSGRTGGAPPARQVRDAVLATLKLLEPGVAMLTNRLGDVLAHTGGFEAVYGGSGLLDVAEPNLTRYVFTDRRARSFFPDWHTVADEHAFDLWTGPSREASEWLSATLAPVAGPEFTRRMNLHRLPPREALRISHPAGVELRLLRETLELTADAQQVVVFHPADAATAAALAGLSGGAEAEGRRPLRLVS